MEEKESEEGIGPQDAISEEIASTTAELVAPEDGIKQPQSHESVAPINSYQIKPNLQERFKELSVKDILKEVQQSILGGKNYENDNVKKWTIKIANDVNEKIKDLEMKRYKHIVQVILGERKGQGVKSGMRCLWDCEVDGYTSEIFMNDTIFCVTTVFAVYLY